MAGPTLCARPEGGYLRGMFSPSGGFPMGGTWRVICWRCGPSLCLGMRHRDQAERAA